MTYKLVKSFQDDSIEGGCIQFTRPDGSKLMIPYCNDNTDYQEYLAWVAEGNTAEAAD